MAKVSLAEHMQERPAHKEDDQPEHCGPFVTISRQFGCYGFSLGLLLLEILNEDADAEHTWKIYQKEILNTLATETNMAEEFLAKERRAKPRLLVDLFRALSKDRTPSGHEIRKRITMIIRGLAAQGYAIIVGQGGAGATKDLRNGLSVRLVAPDEWRSREIALREGLGETKAKLHIKAMDKEWAYLAKLYQVQFPNRPMFDLVYDCSAFTLAQIAQHVVAALRLKRCI